MCRPPIALLFCALIVLAHGPAIADDADDLAEIARLQARVHEQVPADMRVYAAEFGSGITLQLRSADTAPQQAWIASGSDWVELKPSGYIGTSCAGSGIAIGEFSLEAGMRAYYRARTIAAEHGADAVSPDRIEFSFQGDRCEPGWRITLVAEDQRYLYLSFDVDGALAGAAQLDGNTRSELDAASVRALDARASAALPTARVEAAPLPAEAEDITPTGEEYLVASVDGQAYACAHDDIQFVYDYYSIDLRCEGDSTQDPLVLRVAGVKPGKSEHRMVAGMAGPELWVRRGLVELDSDDSLRDTRVWIDALDEALIEGRFEGTLSNASGRRIKIAQGRFRLLPGEGFRVTPP
ncbi:MAG: hypothetical protein AB7E72_09665 [Lysobacterales bacterium]